MSSKHQIWISQCQKRPTADGYETASLATPRECHHPFFEGFQTNLGAVVQQFSILAFDLYAVQGSNRPLQVSANVVPHCERAVERVWCSSGANGGNQTYSGSGEVVTH